MIFHSYVSLPEGKPFLFWANDLSQMSSLGSPAVPMSNATTVAQTEQDVRTSCLPSADKWQFTQFTRYDLHILLQQNVYSHQDTFDEISFSMCIYGHIHTHKHY